MRAVVNENGTVEQVNNYFAYGGLLNDVTTGTDVQTRKYNGKELDRMHGLDQYDYGARRYDAAIGMFTSMDPLCEKYYNINPYMYCAGNPVNRVDMDGMDWIENSVGNIIWKNNVNEDNYDKMLNSGDVYRGKDYVRYRYWNNSKANGLVKEHYKSDRTLEYEIHDGTYQMDFDGKVITAKELTGKKLGSHHAPFGIIGTAYLNAVFRNGNTYTIHKYNFTSGPYGNGPAPNHSYTGSKFVYTNEEGMKIGKEMGWKVYMEDYNGRSGLRMHPDTNSPGTAGCIGINATLKELKDLGLFLDNYIKRKPISINFNIINNPNYGNNGRANVFIGQ